MKYSYNGKVIGILKDGKLIKSGRQAVLFKAMDGFGLPQDLVSHNLNKSVQLKEPGGEKINQIEIRHSGKIYQASTSDFLEHGIKYHRPPYEAQYILQRRFFTVRDTNQLTLV